MVTGFSAAVRTTIRQRADGYCEKCGTRRGIQAHHRRPRGMGGSKLDDTNTASNALLLCGDCHADIESNRDTAINRGWLVPQHHNPADIPVFYRGTWVYLDDLGGLSEVDANAC